MKRNDKFGFTLVELLAVIVILAIILVIAVPKIMSVIEDTKKGTLESTVKMIASAAEKSKVQNTLLSNNKGINCKDIVQINDIDYERCIIEFDNEGNAKVTIKGSGKFANLYVCDGNKTSATASNTSCSVEYGNGATYIEKLEAFNGTSNGLIVDDTVDQNIRYAGATTDVKNKVYFNCAPTDGTNAYGSENYNYESSCEIWRIIGVFDTRSTDSETENPVPRIKIVRDEMLDTYMEWDTTADGVTYINQWGETTLTSDDTTKYPGASLQQYLNGDYYSSLSSIAKGHISDALWHTSASLNDIVSEVYVGERSDTTGTGTTVNYTTKWVGKIGLIYISDFGYAGTKCGNYIISNYNNLNSCGKTRNWLTPTNGYYWTLTPIASTSLHSWLVSSEGYSSSNYYVATGYGVRPSLYLKSNIKIKGGNGNDKPYILGL